MDGHKYFKQTDSGLVQVTAEEHDEAMKNVRKTIKSDAKAVEQRKKHDLEQMRKQPERKCENCGEIMTEDEKDSWCNDCNLPERNPIK